MSLVLQKSCSCKSPGCNSSSSSDDRAFDVYVDWSSWPSKRNDSYKKPDRCCALLTAWSWWIASSQVEPADYINQERAKMAYTVIANHNRTREESFTQLQASASIVCAEANITFEMKRLCTHRGGAQFLHKTDAAHRSNESYQHLQCIHSEIHIQSRSLIAYFKHFTALMSHISISGPSLKRLQLTTVSPLAFCLSLSFSQ